MAAEYQEPDAHVVDYQCFVLDERIVDPSRSGKPLAIRGPRPERLEPDGYFVCLGAAQTFGRFCAEPYPTLLSRRLRLPVLNVSHGGAGTAFFCVDNARLIEVLNAARFVIVQAMSARSEGNSMFACDGVGHYTRRSDGAALGCDEAFAQLLRDGSRRTVRRLVAETRRNWLESLRTLLAPVRTPKILFWFSTRAPDYRERLTSVGALFGPYPQLVTGDMLAQAGGLADHVVRCVTSRGLPQTLVDRVTGAPTEVVDEWTTRPWRVNDYYPSPEMHADAAAALEPSCRVFAGLSEATG